MSKLIRPTVSAKVPYGFVFNNKLKKLAIVHEGMKTNGVRWEKQAFAREEGESALHISVKDPLLPDGDYTLEQYVLVDEVSGQTLRTRRSIMISIKTHGSFKRGSASFTFRNCTS